MSNAAWLAMPAVLMWLAVLLLPWRPWSTRERLSSRPEADTPLQDITVLIPARDEAASIAAVLQGLKQQSDELKVIVIDDQSSDDTASIARNQGLAHLQLIRGTELPTGWSGKLWALEQGLAQARTPLLLLLDADIVLKPGILASLKQKLESEQRDLVSLMARLRMVQFWERLLMPAFIYFFKLLYPFHLANSDHRLVAAAAGGCILVRRQRLLELGGFAAYREALIDDCTLARTIKNAGGRTWLGLSLDAISLRTYAQLGEIWHMVSRTAYTQLGYSPVLLLLCSALMVAGFILPVMALLSTGSDARTAGGLALLLLAGGYVPTLRYYHLSPCWALAMPVIGSLYLAMTWTSAWHYWHGRQSSWKGRDYHRPGM